MFRLFCLCIAVSVFATAALCQELPQQPPVNPSTDGAMIYAQRCIQCHGDQGQGVNTYITIAGPSLEAVHDRQHVITMVKNGKGIMPSFGRVLDETQIEAVADYVTQKLAVISLAGGNLSEGGTLYRLYCAACHRTAVRGGALAFAGVNAPSLVGMTPSTIAGAIRSGPGPMPAFPPAILSDQNVASIVSYVGFMQNPPSPGGNPMNFYGPVAEGLFGWIAIVVLAFLSVWIEKGGKG